MKIFLLCMHTQCVYGVRAVLSIYVLNCTISPVTNILSSVCWYRFKIPTSNTVSDAENRENSTVEVE